MNLSETIRLAFEGIWLNKLRSMLTILGIIIGTATIILVVAVGKGSKESINKQYSQMSVTTIFVMANNQSNQTSSKLNIKDVEVIKEKCPSVQTVAPQLSGKALVSFGSNNQQATLLGVSTEYKDSTNLEFSSGGFFSTVDEESKAKIVIIGAEVAENVLGGTAGDYTGQYISINRQKFIIGGVIERKGDSVGNVSIDDSILIPYTTAQRYVLGNTAIPRLVVQAQDIEKVNAAVDEISVALREAHRLKLTMDDDFLVRDAGRRLLSAQETAKTMSVLLIAIAVIVLVVGGIGIMNVMLVSVRERTKEIGIRLALGARQKDILKQFLFEAMGLSLFGGFIGVILGEGLIPLLKLLAVETLSSIDGVIIAFLFSGIVGVFFGFYPAKKAAEYNPIEALRYE